MARGPLPNPERRRRNAPTIPTTNLPASGFEGPIPAVPAFVRLGKTGRAWWKWAWATPQAAAWGANVGQESVVARRASLEDDLAAIERVDGLDLSLVDEPKDVDHIIRRIAGLATGRLSILREMRELDDRLGLTPKGMAALRWKIGGEVTPAGAAAPTPAATEAKYGHLRVAGDA